MFVPSLPIKLRTLHPSLITASVILAAIAAIGCSGEVSVVAENTNVASFAEPATEIWTRIQDDNFQQRSDFTAGYARMMSRTDLRIQELVHRRSTVPESDLQEWDAAMKDLHDARLDMDDKLSQARTANSDTWDDAKEKANATWERVQDDFDKVLHSTTS